MKKKQIYLTGFMGSGKSITARYLRDLYGLKCLEMDREIELAEQMKISEIFRIKGEAYFREAETNLLKKLSKEENVVVSCGGGTVMRPENVELMKKNGQIVLLTAAPQTIFERVKNNHDRPLLEGNMNVEYIGQLMEARRPSYEAAADVVVKTDGKNVKEICEEIMNEWNSEYIDE